MIPTIVIGLLCGLVWLAEALRDGGNINKKD